MRWYWIDRFLEFESGRYAKAVKAVTLAEDYLHDHFPGFPVMPRSLIIEGMAQTGGLLVCEHFHFTEKVVLAKIASAVFYEEAYPGDTLIYTTTVNYIHKDGAMLSATSHKNGRLHAKMEVVLAHLAGEHQSKSFFAPKAYARMMRLLRALEVGHAADGSPLTLPPELTGAASSPGAAGG